MGVVVQDDLREQEIVKLFGLISDGNRITVDAIDETGNKYEIKTTSKGSVSTARDLGYKHLDKWQDQYWIIGAFDNHTDGFHFTQFWFLSPYHMRDWFSKIRGILDGDQKITTEAISILQEGGARPEVLNRVAQLCADGALLNDPNIPKGYIHRFGIPIYSNHSERLRELVNQYPVDYIHPTDEYFKFND